MFPALSVKSSVRKEGLIQCSRSYLWNMKNSSSLTKITWEISVNSWIMSGSKALQESTVSSLTALQFFSMYNSPAVES